VSPQAVVMTVPHNGCALVVTVSHTHFALVTVSHSQFALVVTVSHNHLALFSFQPQPAAPQHRATLIVALMVSGPYGAGMAQVVRRSEEAQLWHGCSATHSSWANSVALAAGAAKHMQCLALAGMLGLYMVV